MVDVATKPIVSHDFIVSVREMPMPWVAQLVERLKNKAWNRGLPIRQLGSMIGGRTQLYRPCSIIYTCLHSNLLHLYVQRCDLWVCFLLLKHWQWEPCNKAYITPYAIYKPCLGWIAPNTFNTHTHTLCVFEHARAWCFGFGKCGLWCRPL